MAASSFSRGAALAVFLLLLVGQAHSKSSHGGSKRGDGYNQPLRSNSAWKYYRFDTLNKNFDYTSTLPDPTDPTAAGTVATVMGELFDSQGTQIGINQWVRTVIGEDPELPGGTLRSLIQVVYEFGSAEDGYWDDTISVTVVSKRTTGAQGQFEDYDAQITGGTGKFLGATGKMSISDAIFEEGSLQVTSGIVRFDVYVPNNLPRA